MTAKQQTIDALVAEFVGKGILFFGDNEEVNKLRNDLWAVDSGGVYPQELTDIIVDLPLYDGETPQSTAYRLAARTIQAELTEHALYHRLVKSWDNNVYSGFLSLYSNKCPTRLFDALINKIALTKAAYNIEREADYDTFARFLECEKQYIVLANEVKHGLGMEKALYSLIAEVFDGDRNMMTMRANTYHDLLDEYNPNDLPVLPEHASKQFFFAIRRFKSVDVLKTKLYADWYALTVGILLDSPESLMILKSIFPPPSSLEYLEVGEWETTIEICGALLFVFREIGVGDHLAIDLITPIAYGFMKEIQPMSEPLDSSVRKWLWGVATYLQSSQTSIPTRMSWFFHSVRKTVFQYAVPVGIINATANFFSAIGLGLYQFLDRILELAFIGLTDVFENQYQSITQYFYCGRMIISALLPESRRRAKAVWALLAAQNWTQLSPAEMFALGCRVMNEPTSEMDYYAWAQSRLEAMKAMGIDLDCVPDVPIRGFRLPVKPTVAIQELSALAPLMPSETQINPIATDFVKKLVAMGITPGIDGMWFATNERIAKSINRYDVERPPVDEHIRVAVLRSAHALADKYPAMYRNAKYLTPQAALNKVKVKYSPGLPFIPRFRDRKELKKVGILDAIAKEAERLLREGVHPGTFAHCFVKSDIIGLQKLLDGKNIRTVVASDLLSNVLLYIATVEPTRRQPPIDSFVMNAVPRTEGGFRPFYDTLKTYKHVIQADAKEFDSKLAPVLTVDGLVELRSIGYDGSLIQPVATSQIMASYVAMKYAGLINLDDGVVHRHTGGLMTGQGNTSVDNRDCFRMMWIAAWSIVTDRDPIEFFDRNVIGNAGDDDAIGTNQPELTERILQTIRNNFGVEIIVEQEGFENLNLVGLHPGPVPASSIKYYHINGHPIPNYAIAADPAALLAKRTEYRARVAGFKDVAFLMKHLDGVIGSTYQTAHLPEIYGLMADEYEREVTYVLLRFYKNIKVEKMFDEDQNIVSLFIHLGTERERYAGSTKNLRLWLKQHRFPAYNDIMRIALKPQDVALTKMHKDHRKLLGWNPALPQATRLLYGMISVREAMYRWIPNHVVRSLPEFKGEDPTFVMRNVDYTIAKFTWLSLYAKTKRVPKAALFRTALRENPYGSAEDPVGFLVWLSNADHLQELIDTDLEHLRAQMVVITIIYWFVEEIFKGTRNIPVLAIAFNLYAFTMRDINRLYAALNYIYLISTGRSSALISNMTPPDAYAWVKQFSVIASSIFPRKWYYYMLPGVKYIVAPLPRIVELWAAGDAFVQPRPYISLRNLIDIPADWATLVGQIESRVIDDDNIEPLLVVAPTGTGKSTAFVAALFRRVGVTSTIWLICPTIVSRDEYQNDFLLSGSFQILAKDIINDGSRRLKILTYGHARQRLASEYSPGDILIFDEIHLGEVEMIALWIKFSHAKRIQVTATPNPATMPLTVHTYTYAGSRRFGTRVKRMNMGFADLWPTICDAEPHHASRALIVCPTLAKVDAIVNTLGRLSQVGQRLTSLEPMVPKSGIIVATTIVDTAVTIEPAPTCLVDLGLTLSINYDFNGFWPNATPMEVPTGPRTHTQRLGRVGRSGDSTAYISAVAGTGTEAPPRLTPFGILNEQGLEDDLMAFFKLGIMIRRYNQMPGLLGYIGISEVFNLQMLLGDNLALAIYIFIRQSDYQIGDNLMHEWLDLKVAASEHEIINIIVGDIIDNGYGDPRSGNWKAANSILDAGNIVVFINDQPIPATCLCIVANAIVPCGFNKATITSRHKDIYSPLALSPINVSFWRSYDSILVPHDTPALIRDIGDAVNVSLTTFTRGVPPARHSTVLFWAVVRPLTQIFRRYYVDKKLGKPVRRVIGFSVNEALSNVGFNEMVFIKTDPAPVSHQNVSAVNIRHVALPAKMTVLGLTILVAASFNSVDVIVYGEIPRDIRTRVLAMSYPGFLLGDDASWWVLSPSYVRGFFHDLLTAMSLMTEEAFISSIPKRVVYPSVVSDIGHVNPYEIPCSFKLHEDHLTVIPRCE